MWVVVVDVKDVDCTVEDMEVTDRSQCLLDTLERGLNEGRGPEGYKGGNDEAGLSNLPLSMGGHHHHYAVAQGCETSANIAITRLITIYFSYILVFSYENLMWRILTSNVMVISQKE